MRTAAVLALLLALGACGGGSDEPDPAASSTAPADPNAAPTTPAPTGDPAPAALSRFVCQADGAGTFTASGTLSNTTKAAVDFQVTVFVGQPGPAPQSAKTQQVPKVAAGGSTKFQIDTIPVVEGGTCHVQVLTTK